MDKVQVSSVTDYRVSIFPALISLSALACFVAIYENKY
jgi:hypothetical protein